MLSPFLSVCHNRLQNASPHKKTTIRTPTDHPCTNEEPVSNRLMVSVNMLYLCASKCVHDWWSSRCQVVDFLLLLVYLFSHKRAVLDNSRTSSLCPFQSLLVVFVESVSTPKWSSSGFLKTTQCSLTGQKSIFIVTSEHFWGKTWRHAPSSGSTEPTFISYTNSQSMRQLCAYWVSKLQ